jgi:hypothetical protein
MRSREAWLAAMAAVLGVSDGACKKDATDAPAAVREVTSVAASASAPALIVAASASEVASVSVSPSASASAEKTIGLPGTGTTAQRHVPASCGARISDLKDIGGPGEQSCGASREVKAPTAIIAATVTGAATGDERAIASTRPRLRTCANKGLTLDPNETGKAVITVAVAANGEVASSNVTSSNGLGAQTTACMASVLRRATFDAGAARSLVVTIVQKQDR